MILIDEHAEQELLTFLEAFKANPDPYLRCIHFTLKEGAKIARLRETVITSAHRHLQASNPQIFFCEAGDIILLAESMATKDGNNVILDIVDHIKAPADESWVTFHELTRQANTLLARIMPTLEAKRIAEETARKLAERQQQERKRQAILNATTYVTSAEIRASRINRSTTELMMIEDDVFSRRLVENVLQKKFSLTCLSEAGLALEKYAHIAPDLLFLDINLPDVTGHELLERILKLDPDAYIVMLSGNADQKNIAQAMSKGAKGFVAKPFTREKLFQYIERCPTITAKQRVHS